jgi:TetR/AcrR family transcriptional repressor of nem operon
MSNIAESCGLLKGSIYHHFKSKDEIGLEALNFIHLFFKKIFRVYQIEVI